MRGARQVDGDELGRKCRDEIPRTAREMSELAAARGEPARRRLVLKRDPSLRLTLPDLVVGAGPREAVRGRRWARGGGAGRDDQRGALQRGGGGPPGGDPGALAPPRGG